MTLTIEHGMVALAVGLIGHAVISAWRGGVMATTFKAGIEQLGKQQERQEKAQEKLDERLHALDKIPVLEKRIDYLEKNHSLIPRLSGDVEVLKTQAQHSKEMRAVLRRSRPDVEDE